MGRVLLGASFVVGHHTIIPLHHGANFGEGGWLPHHGDEGGLLLEAFAEPDKENVDELSIFDGVPKFAKLISSGLKSLAVDAEGGIFLDVVAELIVEAVYVSVDAVLKELAKRGPKGCVGRGVAEDEIEDLGRNPSVDPLDDEEFVLNPTRIIGARNITTPSEGKCQGRRTIMVKYDGTVRNSLGNVIRFF
jgi:hypothetical protein